MTGATTDVRREVAPADGGHAGPLALLAWEAGRVGRSAVMWTVLAILAAAFAWGAHAAASLHRAQATDQARTLAHQAAWAADVREKARLYAQPREGELLAWQDPTHASSYSRYFLLEYAVKPHLALSPLAVGVSDLAPSRVDVKLETPFAVPETYDFENPRGLALGAFDLAFAVVYLLPIALILVVGLLVTFERDRGVLRLVAAQPVGPRTWLGVRVLAILAWMMPIVLASLVAALAATGAPLRDALPELFAALGVTAAYMLFWAAVATVVLSGWPGAAAAVGALTAVWAALCIGAPLVANAGLAIAAPPAPAVADLDLARRVADDVEASRAEIIAAAFRASPTLASSLDRIDDIDYSTRLTFLAPEIERRLADNRERRRAERRRAERTSRAFEFVAPPLGVLTAFSRLAGTDADRHAGFEAQVRAYQLALRDTVYPYVRGQINAPTPRPPDSYGRLNFTAYDVIPHFAMESAPARARVAAVAPTAVWLLLLAAIAATFARRRLVDWPMDL